MNNRGLARGYTIVEVLIFIAVSGAMLVAAMALISGQQAKTEFAQSMRDMDSRIQDVINDVSTGFYPTQNDFSCSAPASSPITITGVASSQGTNIGCSFIGRAVQFGATSDHDTLITFTIAGRQYVTGTTNTVVTNLTEATPIALSPRTSNNSIPDKTEKDDFAHKLEVNKMFYGANNIAGVAFISRFPGSGGGGQLLSKAQQVDVVPIPDIAGNAIGQDQKITAEQIKSLDSSSPMNPSQGIMICFDSTVSNQHGWITIGSNDRQLTTNIIIKGDKCNGDAGP